MYSSILSSAVIHRVNLSWPTSVSKRTLLALQYRRLFLLTSSVLRFRRHDSRRADGCWWAEVVVVCKAARVRMAAKSTRFDRTRRKKTPRTRRTRGALYNNRSASRWKEKKIKRHTRSSTQSKQKKISKPYHRTLFQVRRRLHFQIVQRAVAKN